jgi:hypothetical protein
MKLKKIGTLAISLCFTGILLQGTAVAGPNAAAATVATEVQDEIFWVAASVEQSDVSSLQIRILTPKANGKRSVFQKCIFNFSGTGEYRCGIDVAEGSIASKKSGTWTTKVLVDGAVTDRISFSL